MEQVTNDRYTLINGDCIEVMQALPDRSIGVSMYSLPFRGMYQYSSSERDLSNCRTKEQFMDHYEFVVNEIFRLTPAGRISAVHCCDIPSGNSGCDHLDDFPGDIIRLHEKIGFHYAFRIHIWKEPLTIRNKLLLKNLFHTTLCEDSTRVGIANSDYLIVFRKRGKNKVPVSHPKGLTNYAGSTEMPEENKRYKSYTGNQLGNKFSHWIWQQYASSNWMDIRLSNTLPYLETNDEDEKHLHPMSLDIYERGVILWSNEDEVFLEPFMGTGGGPYTAVNLGRKAVGVELKPAWYRQACRNLEYSKAIKPKQGGLFG